MARAASKRSSKPAAGRRPRGAAAARPIGLVVLGMHRSGSSALTRSLALLGARLPSDLLQATDYNPKGFWEWAKAYELHNEILASIDSRWDDWSAIDPRWFASPTAEAKAQTLAAMMTTEFADAPLFAIKDPRASRFAPLWRRAGEVARMDLRWVIIVRNPLEVAASLAKGKGLSVPQGLLLWLRYALDAERSTRGGTRVILTYDQLLEDWRGCLGRVAEQLGFVWPRWTARAETEIDGFLDSQDRHHKAGNAIFRRGRHTPEWVKTAYAAMLELATSESATAYETLDRVNAEFTSAAGAFWPLHRADREQLIVTNEKRIADKNALSMAADRLADSSTREEALAGSIKHLRGQVDQLMIERDRLREKLAEERQARGRLAAELEARMADEAWTRELLGQISELADSMPHALEPG